MPTLVRASNLSSLNFNWKFQFIINLSQDVWHSRKIIPVIKNLVKSYVLTTNRRQLLVVTTERSNYQVAFYLKFEFIAKQFKRVIILNFEIYSLKIGVNAHAFE